MMSGFDPGAKSFGWIAPKLLSDLQNTVQHSQIPSMATLLGTHFLDLLEPPFV